MERVLGGGERHEHRVAVEAGWYVRLEIEQVGVDVAASLLGPDGATLFSTDNPDGLQDKEIVAVIAPAAGELRLAVTPRDAQAAPGAYRVTVVARRPAGPGDTERAAAQKAMAEAWRLERSQEESARREALRLLREAVRLWQVAGEIEEEIRGLNELGILEDSLSETSAALASFQRALLLSLEIGALESEAFAHNNLAGLSGALQDAPRLDHYQRALAIFRQLGNLRQQGRVLYGMGIIYRNRVDLDQAFRYLSESLPLRRVTADLRGELNSLTALASVYLGRGEMDQAVSCLERALELSRSIKWGEASVFSTQAQVYRYRGELGEALVRLQQARDFYQRAGDERYEARALHSLGALYLDLGDLDGAQRSYEQGLALVSGRYPEGESHFLNSLGWTLYLRNDPQAALGYFERALTLSQANNLPAGIAQALGRTGTVYVSLGRAEEGLKLLQEELELRRKSGDRPAEARSLLEMGGARQALGDLDQAGTAFREALDLGQRVGSTDFQAACLYRWAVLDRQRGDLRQALERVEQALRIIESVRGTVSSEKLRITYLASKRAWYELAIDLRMRLEELEPGEGHAAAALEISERARARGLLDLIAEGRIDVREGIAPDLKRQETEIEVRLSWLQERLDEALRGDPESGLVADLRIQLDQAGEKMERLREEIRREHRRYAEVLYPTPLGLDQIRELLDPHTALLEYFVGAEASFLFVVTRDGLSAHRLPAAQDLERKVQDLREALEQPGSLRIGRFRLQAGLLYQILLGPVDARLDQVSHLLISTDGPLSLVPFEVLLADPTRGTSYRNLDYLLREHAISYVPSASVLDGLREQRTAPAAAAAPKQLIAFGDPIYPSAQAAIPVRGPASPWTAPPLPGSGREVAAIASLYPESEVALYLRDQATEENVKSNPLLETARRIHFATHGVLDEASPQLSGLMLTRDPASQGDGVLRVFEIFNLRLNADLVTLSACETALGEQVTGEGMVGLTRAFLYAGARSLLVSLWPVSDLSTPDLMTAFYRHLGNGELKAEALYQAKLERIAAGDEPYRWAPFILAGDSR